MSAVDQGFRIIVADPRFSIAASKASHHLPIKSVTDRAALVMPAAPDTVVRPPKKKKREGC